jgi:Na+-driven multidrug efflux pump
LGVAGSGVGTTIGRGCGVLLQLWLLTRGRSRVVLHLRDIRLRPELMWRLVKLAVGGATQYLTGAASWIALVRMTASFGSAALAGYTLALRIILFALLPGWGLASAAATMVGQNLGAKKPERAEQSVWRTGLFNMSFMGLVTVVLLLFARPLVEIFTRESDVVSVASSTLHVVAYGYVFYAWGMVLVQAFNGAGDTVTPNVLYLICFWAWQLPLAWFLAFQSAWGPVGIFAAIAIAQSTLAVTALAMFRRGKWKTQRV